jgi:SPP1 family predicted phage head-tail adaptor
MEPGKLNRKVSIRQRGSTQDAIGQPIETWTEITGGSLWANIRHPRGAESLRADKDVSIVQASIRIRRRTDVTAAMRVYFGSTVYEIKAVLPDERDRNYVDLSCEVVS